MQLPHLDWVNQDSPYLRQLGEGFRWLRFDRDIEQAFEQYHAEVFLVRMRRALLVATLLFIVFALTDAFILPAPVSSDILTIRLGLIVPTLVLTWLATYREQLQGHIQLIGGTCALICGLGVDGIIWVARAHDFPLPYEGIILVTVFFYFITGLRFTTAALCGWLTFLGYLLVGLITDLPTATLRDNLFFLGIANLIGCVGCYFLEHATRQNFLAQGLLQELAEKDFLTGLLNRRAFTERAERSLRQAVRERAPIALVMMDVDFFKRYNDHYGHSAGDEALRSVARVIGRQARRALDVTARYGGEEFVGFWYGVEEADALAILERLRAEVEEMALPHAKSDVAPVMTLSIGLAWLKPEPDQTLSDALRLADVALYLAKEQGRNRVVGKRPGGGPVA